MKPARQEDARLLTGQGRFTADLQLPGMLHAFVIRSDQARGHIRRLNLGAVRAAPGVHMVLTAQELQAWGARELPCLVQPPGQRSVLSVEAPGFPRMEREILFPAATEAAR